MKTTYLLRLIDSVINSVYAAIQLFRLPECRPNYFD